jgi:hypothetical protein
VKPAILVRVSTLIGTTRLSVGVQAANKIAL